MGFLLCVLPTPVELFQYAFGIWMFSSLNLFVCAYAKIRVMVRFFVFLRPTHIPTSPVVAFYFSFSSFNLWFLVKCFAIPMLFQKLLVEVRNTLVLVGS